MVYKIRIALFGTEERKRLATTVAESTSNEHNWRILMEKW